MKQSLGAKIMAGAVPVWVVGAYDKEGKPNLATAAWVGVCCSDPPCIGVSFRKATYSHGCIVDRKAFTVSVPSVEFIKETDYVGIASGRDGDKWLATGLTPVKSELVDAPYVSEFPLILECRLIHTLELGLHTHFIGEIVDVKAEGGILEEKGNVDVLKLAPFFYVTGKRVYHGIGPQLGKAHSMGAELRNK
jgi:flavin reductase (DIM6/NTAB) family NADH-FMN oxidoreductase RutF